MLEEIQDYWNARSASYAEHNLEELASIKREKYQSIFLQSAPIPLEKANVLDIGCGPGIFSVILAEMGANVSALDYTPKMLEKAQKNATKHGVSIRFFQGDAQNLPFETGCFDLVVSRNLTWNLNDPIRAYHEWYRVLKKGGKMLNFDANWYLYLYDTKCKEHYQKDRQEVAKQGIIDHMTDGYPDAKKMETIAKSLPLSKIHRPQWDRQTLESIGFENITCDEDFYQEIWDESEKLMFASTPMFFISAQK
ncbi:methyltransferase domain-containing protein [Helicobacter sp. 11S02596-1]|uniref:class I SAM-dependent methyltransferase n=1 Tax=Helicobacter sp. 11S02596-1 TaxID=1476194 RepID=UPI000BA4ED0E|nr:methyltransferase domain-containing protein [Helicobacter sp. 11S02596-1]PAF43225.1 hypothetical protein BJI48_05650 [Helicobacter sp. 11S02596-1]